MLINDSNSSGHILSKPGPSISENGPSIFEKCRDPQKTANFGGKKLFLVSEKNFPVRKWVCHVLFAKKMEKFRQNWPQQPLKHFTAAYRGFPPCTQSQHPINRETGYSNVLTRHRTRFLNVWLFLCVLCVLCSCVCEAQTFSILFKNKFSKVFQTQADPASQSASVLQCLQGS